MRQTTEHKNTHIFNRRNKKTNQRNKKSKQGNKALLGQSTGGYNGKRDSGHTSKTSGEE
jgi:hypothetical protein